MKFFLTLLFLLFAIRAEETATCYTIQLVSLKNTPLNVASLQKAEHGECKTMQIGSNVALRCGCYEKLKDAKEAHRGFVKKYPKSVIVTTYASRFKDAFAASPRQSLKHISLDELQLLLETFLYNNDLEEAYKVVSEGCARAPHSLYWHEQAAKVARWSSRPLEAMSHMIFLYKKTNDPVLEEQILTYALGASRYEDALPIVRRRFEAEQNQSNKTLLLYVYEQLGVPEEAASVFMELYRQNPHKQEYVGDALRIYLETGQMQEADEAVVLIEEKKLYTHMNLFRVASYYYMRGKIDKAYVFLKQGIASAKKEHLAYWIFLSDLAWHMLDYESAAKASLQLIEQKEGRIVDYERVVFYYYSDEKEKSYAWAKEGYEKYGHFYLFYSFATLGNTLGKYDELAKSFAAIKSGDPLLEEGAFWFLKAQVALASGDFEGAKKALEHAKKLSLGNVEALRALVWFYKDYGLSKELALMLQELEESHVDPKLYFLFASAYYDLHQIDKAMGYLQKIRRDKPQWVDVDFLLLEATLYAAQENADAQTIVLRQARAFLERQVRENPSMRSDKSFLYKELQVALHLDSKEHFKAKLSQARSLLDAQEYEAIAYSFALTTQSYEQSRALYYAGTSGNIWQDFNNAMLFGKHETMIDLLQRHRDKLPRLDASLAAGKEGEVSLAQTLAWDALQDNASSYQAYRRHLDLTQKYADRFSLKVHNVTREELVQNALEVKNSIALIGGWYATQHLKQEQNKEARANVFAHMPSSTTKAELGLQRLFLRGHAGIGIGYRKAMQEYISWHVRLVHTWNDDLETKLEYLANGDALESIGLLLGARKSSYSFGVVYNVLPSTRASFSYECNNYDSQEGTALAEGSYMRLGVNRTIKSAYPEIAAELFYDQAKYERKENGFSKLETTLYQAPRDVIPQDFYNVGITLGIGASAAENYTRVWRPFGMVTTSFNGKEGAWNVSGDVGIGGKILHQDHTVIGFRYADTVVGVPSTTREIYLNYTLYYNAP